MAGDAHALADLVTQLGYPTEPREMRERFGALLARPDFRTLVAEDEGRVIGLAGLQIVPSYEWSGLRGRLVALVVDQAWRGRGVGRVLLGEAEAALRSEGVPSVTLTTATHRSAAHRFYEGLGYRRTGLRFVKSLETGA